MSVKVLQLVNSPLFAPVRVIANPEQAVIYLGIETVRALAITESIFSQFGTRNHPGFSPRGITRPQLPGGHARQKDRNQRMRTVAKDHMTNGQGRQSSKNHLRLFQSLHGWSGICLLSRI